MSIFRLNQQGKQHAIKIAMRKFLSAPSGENAFAAVSVIHSAMKPDCGLGWDQVEQALYEEFGTTTHENLVQKIESEAACLSKQS